MPAEILPGKISLSIQNSRQRQGQPCYIAAAKNPVTRLEQSQKLFFIFNFQVLGESRPHSRLITDYQDLPPMRIAQPVDKTSETPGPVCPVIVYQPGFFLRPH
jgi:hypothetical protein